MNIIRNIIRKKISNLFEVRVIDPKVYNFENEEPFRENDTIRVYHGFNSYEDAILALRVGLSGKEKAKRVYSYESNNNPYGLFVTLDFNIAKNFVGSSNHRVIMELHVKYSDLESPVWPGGNYTVQGQMSKNFNDDDTREDATIKARGEASDSQYPIINQSDRPEVAASLISYEKQALFVGHLNPNMIKKIWYDDWQGGREKYERISGKEFLGKFNKNYEPSKMRGFNNKEILSNKGKEFVEKHQKFFNPNDDFSKEILIQTIKDKYKSYNEKSDEEVYDKIIKVIKRNPSFYLWPKQIEQMK